MEPLTGLALYRESCVPVLSQERLASLIGVHVNTIYSWEREGVKTAPRLLALARLFTQLGMITDDASALAFWEACRGRPLVPPPELCALPRPQPPAEPAGGPPPCSLLPLHRNPRFVGRRRELERLAAALASAQAVAAVSGMGGAGKSQLACEYSYRYGQRYPGGVFWISFADPEQIPEQIARCGAGDALDLDPAFERLPLGRQVQLVLAAWRAPTPRLLIFDTCEHEALLQRWQPTIGGCRVLVTSRLDAWPPALLSEHIRLGGLARAESVGLLGDYLRSGADERDAAVAEMLAALSAALDDMPLALHLAGSYLALRRAAVSPAALLTELNAMALVRHPALAGDGRSPTGGPAHLGAVLARSYDLLLVDRPRERLARALLLQAACLVPGELIPRELLLAMAAPAGRTALEDALALAVGLSLLQVAPGGELRLHRLVAAFLRERPEYAAAHREASAAVCAALASREPQAMPAPLHDLPHLHAIALAALERGDVAAADLARAVAFQLWLHRRDGVVPLLTRAAAIYERALGPAHPMLAEVASLLGLDLQTRSRWGEARRYHEQTLAIRERALGALHPETAAAYNNLGYLLCWLADYPAARAHIRHGLRVRVGLHGLMHADTARSIHNLGYLLLRMGRLASARRLLRLALTIREQLLPAQHPAVALSLSLLGEASTRLGDTAPALELHGRALAIWRSLFGEQHPYVAEGFYRLAETQLAQGEPALAVATLRRARAIYQACLADDLAVVEGIRVVERLGVALAGGGEQGEAARLLAHALDAWRRLFGELHPHTARARYHLGALTWGEGRGDAARELLAAAHAAQASLFGDRHPDTIETAALLAQTQARAGAPGEAAALR